MDLKLYRISDADNVINKTLGAATTIQVVLKRDFNIINPVIILRDLGNNLQSFNYCEFPEFGRKYFVRDVVNISADIWQLNCECDVLETYKNAILEGRAKFLRKIKTGDYLEISVDSSYLKTISKYESDVTIEGQHSIVLSTVGNS